MPCCGIHPRVVTPEDEKRELEDPLEWLPPGELERRSNVARFYDGASVFITGVTGFIGTLILEKLLRSCPGISTIYVLVRDKKGVPLRERLGSHLEKPVFGEARKACPDYLQKVVPIAGDCAQPGLGISPADAAELCRKVTVVFHVAATVRFDADLRTATITNVGSTLEIIALIKRMPSLKAFVYVSTAYSNAHLLEIGEKFYPPGLTAEELLKLISVMSDEQLSQLLPQLLGDWPNTYTFTKAVAEDVIRVRTTGLPVSIIRPSIVLSTHREPVAQWLGNLYGPGGLAVGTALGVLHAMHMDSNILADALPADIVANATIACSWDAWRRHSTQGATQENEAQPVIYNCVSTTRHPISWGSIHYCILNGRKFPTIRTMWYCGGYMCKRKFAYVLGAVFFHLIPAIIADTVLHLKGMKPILWDLYARIHGVSQALEPFITKQWTFKDDNLVSLISRLGDVDRKLFPCDITEVDLEWHYSNMMRGLRVYVLDESYDNLEQARRRYLRLTILHYTLVTVAGALLLFMLWRFLAAQMGF